MWFKPRCARKPPATWWQPSAGYWGDVYAMLLIDELPFFALQNENLQTINLLLGYYTDGLSTQALSAPLVGAGS